MREYRKVSENIFTYYGSNPLNKTIMLLPGFEPESLPCSYNREGKMIGRTTLQERKKTPGLGLSIMSIFEPRYPEGQAFQAYTNR